MNKTVALAIIIFLAVCGISCDRPSGEGTDPYPDKAREEGDLKLAFITCSVEAKFFEPVKKGMGDAAAMLGVECDFLGTV